MSKFSVITKLKRGATTEERQRAKTRRDLLNSDIMELECKDHGQKAKAVVWVREVDAEVVDYCCEEIRDAIATRIESLPA